MSDKKKDRPWDGRSRIPTQQYKDNYNEIFKKKALVFMTWFLYHFEKNK